MDRNQTSVRGVRKLGKRRAKWDQVVVGSVKNRIRKLAKRRSKWQLYNNGGW